MTGGADRVRRVARRWFPDANVDADVDLELRFHLEMRERDFREAGLSEAEAREAARLRFGDPDVFAAELRTHDRRQLARRRRLDAMSEMLRDARYGARALLRQPGFTASVVAVLALGIGASAAIFSAVDAALLRPLPFAEPDRLVIANRVGIPHAEGSFPTSRPSLDDVRATTQLFDRVAAYGVGGLNLTGGTEPVRVRVGEVTPEFFATLGVRPAYGRTFTADEGRQGGPPVMIISDGLWARQFGRDPAALGRTVELNRQRFQIVGIMPKNFAFPARSEIWRPLQVPFSFGSETYKGSIGHSTIMRLAPGVTLEAARARFADMVKRGRPPGMKMSDEETPAGLLPTLRERLVGTQRKALLFLVGGAGLVLLIACANVTNLLLARGAARRREMAVRAVLGATRGRLVRQLLVETLMLTGAGALAGLVVAYASLGVLTALLPPNLVAVAPPRLDLRVLGFSLALAALTGLLSGAWPALGTARRDVGAAVKAGGEFGSTADGRRARGALVVAEVALALVLLVGAGLMLESFRTLANIDSGVRPDHAATMELTLSRTVYATSPSRWGFYQRVLERLAATPGVEAAAVSNVLPLAEDKGFGFMVHPEGKPRPTGWDDSRLAHWLVVSPGYFRAMGVPLLRGREFAPTGDSNAVVINRTLAQNLWPGEDPVGKRLDAQGGMRTVLGVVGDVRSFGLDQTPIGQMYMPMAAMPTPYVGLVARGSLPPAALAARMREAVRAVDPAQAVYNVRPLEELVSASITPQRTNTLLVAAFGALALVLAAVGVYGVLAYGVAQRTREIGIRLALGAERRDVLRMVLRQGMGLALLGAALGVGGAYAASRVMQGLLFEVSPTDPRVFVGAPLVLLATALLATWVPARRATRVDPMRALRAD